MGRALHDDVHGYTVIGVARDLKPSFMVAKVVPTVFVPLSAKFPGATLSITAVVRGQGADTVADVTSAIASLDPNLTVFNVGSMNERLDQFNTIVLVAKGLYGGIGVFGLILACIGLAGVTAYAVARRRKEIGIRMALGARGHQVLQLVMKEGAVMVTVGSAIGFVAAFLITRVLSSLSSSSISFSPREPAIPCCCLVRRCSWPASPCWPAIFRRAAPRAWIR